MKHKFWYFVHNAIAHPLLTLGFEWTDNFHNWSADKLGEIHGSPEQPLPHRQHLFEELQNTCGFIALEDDMQQIINAHRRDLKLLIDPEKKKRVNNLIYSCDIKDGKSGILDLDTLEVFCFCDEPTADIILDAIIESYKM